MKITYLSHSCFTIQTATHNLIVDPFLNGNPKATVSPAEIKCDYILVTHGHNDHLGDAVEIALNNEATIVANYEIAQFCARQGAKVHPMNIGGAWNFPFGKVKFTIAHHGSAWETGEDFIYLGNPAGILVFTEGKTLYHAGDTGLFLDMKLIAELHPIDVAILPIGDNFTMGIDDACKALEFLCPKLAIPMHYDTFGFIEVDAQAFAQKGSRNGVTVKVLAIGESVEV